ncbi:MAG: hypothetical protein ACFFDB_18415 [Promethearchaeota archaeon]
MLIIKKSTFEYLQKRATEISTFPGMSYDDLMEEYLQDHYVSYENFNDSGRFFTRSAGIHYIRFNTIGIFKYSFKYDPFFIDLMWFLYGLLGLTVIVGIVIIISRISNMIFPSDKKSESSLNMQMEKYCERCGSLIELNSLFCHECGIKLNTFK